MDLALILALGVVLGLISALLTRKMDNSSESTPRRRSYEEVERHPFDKMVGDDSDPPVDRR